jgi:long-subunit acyl-CoA synthetase (AMP-forming)
MTTTFPHLLLQHAAQRPQAPALREKEYGIWQTWSWSEAAETVRHMACGLAALGMARGQNLAFISDNRPHVYMGFIAVQALGAVPIPLYQDAVAAEMRFVIEDAEIDFAFAENQEQVDKLLEVRESVTGLGPDDNVISYLPPAWVGDHLFSFAQWLVAGFTINCPESASTVSIDLREIGPATTSRRRASSRAC